MFFVLKKRPSTHHILPPISPRFHHQNHALHAPFRETPLKNTGKSDKNPGSRQGFIFSENKSG